ncbi:MAG: helix-turn-helix domain-containing protein [Streptococcaceae bacterium]|jgi:phage repressor protein C with HTH and peptisase S24 domain|nr:helix-turn-helix domain-containing protein [Streptococcaceae bacterium]
MEKASHFAFNLKALREAADMEQIELAQKLGRKSASSISEWERGKYTPKAPILSQIADIFDVSLTDLMEKDLSTSLNSDEPQLTEVKVIEKVAAGFGYNYVGNNYDIYRTDRTDLAGYDFATLVKGDSMEPEFYDGDVVLVKQTFDTPRGGIFIVDYDEQSYIKQVMLHGNTLILHSLNPKYQDRELPVPPDEFIYWNIPGEVVDSFTPVPY